MKYIIIVLLTFVGWTENIHMLPKQDRGLDNFSLALSNWRLPCPKLVQELALSKVRGQDRKARIAKALKDLKDKDPNVRSSVVDALGLIKAKEYAKQVAELLKDKKPS